MRKVVGMVGMVERAERVVATERVD